MIKVGYKLVTKRKDGSLCPLFINKRMTFEVGKWHKAEPHKKKGFAFRPGFHILAEPVAPHLKPMHNRVWVKVAFLDAQEFVRPISQGGKWFLANYMKVLGEI